MKGGGFGRGRRSRRRGAGGEGRRPTRISRQSPGSSRLSNCLLQTKWKQKGRKEGRKEVKVWREGEESEEKANIDEG